MKRLALLCLALLTVFALAGSALAAYVPEPFDGYPYDDQPDAVIEKDVIVVMGSSNFDPSYPSGSYLQAVAKLFMEQNPNIEVQLNYGSWGDLWNKVGVMLGNRQGPDILVGPREYLLAPGRGGGQWEDILTVPDEYYFDEFEKAVMGPAILESCRFPGREGYMIWPWTNYIDGTGVINGDMVREAGYDPLEIQKNGWTWDDFLKIARVATKDTNNDGKIDQWGSYFGPTVDSDGTRLALTANWCSPIALRLKAEGQTFIDIKTGDFFLDKDAFLKGFTWIQKLVYEEKVIPAESIGASTDECRDAFVQGKTMFCAAGSDILDEVAERNRLIDKGLETGKKVDAYLVPRPKPDKNSPNHPIRVYVYGYYHFKQEPYKGDAHTRNVFKFAKFLANPVFQPLLAHSAFIPSDMRVWMGEDAWFPGILGSDANAQYMEQIAQTWHPRLDLYITMATTTDVQNALTKFRQEVLTPTSEEVYLNKITPQQAVDKLQAALDKIAQDIPKDKRLTSEAPAMVKDLEDFAKKTGQKI
ncbi:MAG: carbohydrate ABC transporter substrate-binding protein [Firmicutes bacterium]|nr:carbohydrate ABC transporter substrate-binding protein [Bacillota bacterium]